MSVFFTGLYNRYFKMWGILWSEGQEKFTSWLTFLLSLSFLFLTLTLFSVNLTSAPSSHLPPGQSRWTFMTGTETGGKFSCWLSLSFSFLFFSFIHFQLRTESLKCHTLFCLTWGRRTVLSVLLLGITTNGELHPPGTCWVINQKYLTGERLKSYRFIGLIGNLV